MLQSADPTISPRRTRVPAGLLVALAVGTQFGCTREFFREWANQDATELVFEKSRDPRWRIDLFSVEPPALSRYASYGDPDNPPAPPDDYATEAMSPVPQWPDTRLIVAMEGTGYLDMLEAWRAETPEPPASPPRARPSVPSTVVEPAPPLPPPSVPSSSVPPFSPGGNSGPPPGSMPPSNVPGPPAANPPSGDAVPPQAHTKTRDTGVRLAAFQQTGVPLPATQPAGSTGTTPPRTPEVQPPPVGMDPDPINRDLSAPTNPRPDLSPKDYRASEEATGEMAGMLVPDVIDFNDAEASGLPRNSRPYRLTMEQSFRLALINARVYQFQLETVYLNALTVSLQRFQFQPQFYAGNGVQTPTVAGIPSPNQPISFTYNTRETGSPLSGLNIGTVAGMGKAFNTGARLAMGFANTVVFNFLGQNSRQPTVRSFLPLTLVQPFLRGGGRAVNLEALTNAERNLVYSVRNFAKFRQEFIVATLVGGTAVTNFGSTAQTPGFSGGGNSDPVIGFLNVVQDLQQLENDIKNIRAFEKLLLVYRELIVGEASGLTQLQVDQVDSSLQRARLTLVNDRTIFRQALDRFKWQLGMPPDTPIILDRSLTQPFKDVFDGIDQWQRNPKRDLTELPAYAGRLPNLPDVIIDGRSVLSVYTEGKNDEDDLEDLLLAGERVAFEHRLDLMNARAQLYDAWRQIRVQANSLKGVFNVTLTNTFITPPATTNPFAFIDQAKQFSLVLNTELPLVRMNERNLYRGALIGYERQRRSLQAFEDNLKQTIRDDIRTVHQQYLTYEINRKNFVLTIRQKDQAFEQIIAPPQGAAAGGGGTAQAASAATQTSNLITAQSNLLTIENTLVSAWLSYQVARLSLYRDLGTLPYDEWEAFHELFPPDDGRQGPGPQPGAGVGAGATLEPGPSGIASAGQPEVAGR